MIIWGTKGRKKVVAEGDFHCPGCCGTRRYRHVQVSKWFTLYFIPVFRMQQLGEYLECVSCRDAYKPELLEYKAQTPEERIAAAVVQDLTSGTPVQIVIRKLVNQGLSEHAAATTVASIAGDRTRTCSDCRFTYLEEIGTCTACGRPLVFCQPRATP